METQQEDQDLGNRNPNNSNSSSSSYLCRQSSTRWTPTSDQIRILKELYYSNGIRSPTADQIQRIAARLRQYGKIEGKNVFYWFQNHKARERQKKRFTPPAAAAPPPLPSTTTTLFPSPFSDHNAAMHIQSHHQYHPPYFYNQQNKLYAAHHISPAEAGSSSSSCSQGLTAVGCGYGSVEKSFRECSISPGESRGNNFGSWVGVDAYSLDKIKQTYETLEEEDDRGELSTEIETLPLFPIQGGTTTNMNAAVESEHSGEGYWFRSDGRTSLELSLNSYGYYN